MSTAAPDSASSPFEFSLPPKPYPGLRPFEAAEWPVFFGRERMADEVIARIIQDRFVVVHGGSGCGKSSLIYAAVLPRLEQDGARGGVTWRTCAAAPGEEPLWNLARSLARAEGRRDDRERILELRRVLNFGRDGAAALSALVRRGQDDRVCILVDQFEELFAHAKRHGPSEASLLVELLCGIQQGHGEGLHAVLTMRSEFLGSCAQFKGFAEAVNAAQYLLPRMDHADLLRAIREAATLYEGEIELDLAERLISDAGGTQDELPLIQHGLMLLHRQHALPERGVAAGPWKLTLDDYTRGGRSLGDMLSDHADEVADDASRKHAPDGVKARVVEDIFRALTDINADGQAIRRPQTLRELVAVTGAPEPVVRGLVDAFRVEGVSLLRPYGEEPLALDDRVDISHEALIRCWKRIAEPRDGWLAREFRNGLVWQSLLVQADSFDKDTSNVLSAATTEERVTWLKRRNAAWSERYGGGWERVQLLVEASVTERGRQEREREEEQRREAQARVREGALRRKYRLALLLALGAVTCVGVTSMAVVDARRQRADANKQRANAVTALVAQMAALEQESAARKLAEEKRKEMEGVVTDLNRSLSDLQSATAGGTVDKAHLIAAVNQAQGEIQQHVAALSSVADLPRVYIQISDESQREAAQRLASRLEHALLGADPIDVPGIELKRTDGDSLRCFDAAECDDGRRLVEIVNRELVSRALVLENLTRLGEKARLRPRHYEIWFGPGRLELVPDSVLDIEPSVTEIVFEPQEMGVSCPSRG